MGSPEEREARNRLEALQVSVATLERELVELDAELGPAHAAADAVEREHQQALVTLWKFRTVNARLEARRGAEVAGPGRLRPMIVSLVVITLLMGFVQLVFWLFAQIQD